MRKISKIIIHCSDTPVNMDIGVPEIRDWHVNERGWADIGYHYVILRNGATDIGRSESTVGAHVAGHNDDSIGICLVGGKPNFNFTSLQMDTLKDLLFYLIEKYPDAKVYGHNNFTDQKECPMFDVRAWWYGQ